GTVACTIDGFAQASYIPIVTDNTMGSRGSSCVHRGMTWTSIGGDIIVVAIFHHKAFIHQPLQSSFHISVFKFVKILLSHLINDDSDYQLGPVWLLTGGVVLSLGGSEREHQSQPGYYQFFHFII